MDFQSYKAGIEECWNDEKYGEALFKAMAEKAAGDTELVNKLRQLEALEVSTYGKMSVLAEKYNFVPDESMVEKGRARADEVWPWGWQKIMEEFERDATEDIARMQDLLDAAPEEDRLVLKFLVDHEVALKDFMMAELASDEHSVAPVKALLEL